MSKHESPVPPPIGLWFVGARGAIATTVTYGLAALASGRVEPIGLVSELADFREHGLAPLASFVVGGWEVRAGTLAEAALELVANNILPAALAASGADHARAVDARIVPGVSTRADLNALPAVRERSAATGRAQVRALAADLEAFRAKNGLARVVVVNVASTEAALPLPPAAASLAAFERALDDGSELPPSTLYAYAALSAGCAHVNFTPSAGATWPALREFARARRLPITGDDGKTGETLVKTALAPMFAHRNLRVLAWQGYNMLGNRDGAVLADPLHKAAKVKNKDAALRTILGNSPSLHSHVAIDYVPSLHDWKTALDYVHFEGFLGARMSLQFTWTGSDSALAAPLVIDLARFADLALRDGVAGELAHLACFFKSPLTGGSHDFHVQSAALLEWARART
jgi:myo-inositol-1-phosphate synthase